LQLEQVHFIGEDVCELSRLLQKETQRSSMI